MCVCVFAQNTSELIHANAGYKLWGPVGGAAKSGSRARPCTAHKAARARRNWSSRIHVRTQSDFWPMHTHTMRAFVVSMKLTSTWLTWHRASNGDFVCAR